MSATAMSQRMLFAGVTLGKFHAHMLAEQIEAVMQDTWGHMQPKVRELYHGHVLFTKGVYAGDYCIIDFDLRLADGTELEGGPWFYSDVHDQALNWIDAKGQRPGGIWRFDGTFERLKNGKSRWRGKAAYWRSEDGTYFATSLSVILPPPVRSGGYHNLDALKKLKGDV